jgi:hypothetical protein
MESLHLRHDFVDLNGCEALSGDPWKHLFVKHWHWTIDRGAGNEQFEGDRNQCLLELPRTLTSAWTTWHVTLVVTRSDGQLSQPESRAVRFRDLLIASLGDSAASGEGVPDVNGKSPVWAAEGGGRCDRSGRAASARAAWQIESTHGTNDLTSVTFWHLACSGAAITDPDLPNVIDPRERAAGQYGNGGILTPYDGESAPTQPHAMCNPFTVPPRVTPDCHPPLPAQIDELSQLMQDAGRHPDAVLIAAGANDVGWSDLAKLCYPTYLGGVGDDFCLRPKFTTPILARRDKLANRYGNLAAALDGAGIRADTVFLTEYWDPTHDDRPGILGGPYAWYCPNDPFVPSGGTRRWAYYNLVVPMKSIARGTAAVHGWHFIGGVQAAFAGHGLCAADNWIVSPEASKYVVEGTVNGGWHANATGQDAIAKLILSAIRPVLGVNIPDRLGQSSSQARAATATLRGPASVRRGARIVARAEHLSSVGRYELALTLARGVTKHGHLVVCRALVTRMRDTHQTAIFSGRIPSMMTCWHGQRSRGIPLAVTPGRYVLGIVGARTAGPVASPARILRVTG